ncbi:MAG: Gfo/Idh/MocA family protein [Cyclobacteriaceae bacterium]
MSNKVTRRNFVKTAGAASLGLSVAGSFFPAYGKNAPSNKMVIAVMGLNGRGNGLTREMARIDGYEIAYICDVDENAISKGLKTAQEHGKQSKTPKGIKDFRTALDDKNLDAIIIAAPDHWHTPASILAMQAGKHVFVEKPCGHNPKEGEMLVEAQKKYNKIVQMGNQQRSSIESIEAIDEIRKGAIGKPYFAKAWYANTRGPIGTGQQAQVPSWLDYELWQGPAPRVAYQDNLIHYNWHWFTNWGTGEICNNGTHEIDICRWALDVDYPTRVSSQGGRYHYDDDWQFYDTQVTSFDFEDGKTITWEGRSCNGRPVEGRGRGSAIYGTDGTMIIDRNGYELYDRGNNLIRKVNARSKAATMDTVGGDSLTALHFVNFYEGVTDGAKLNSHIEEGHKSTLLCHLGNIAQDMGKTLETDPSNGHIKNNPEAMKRWSREYAQGWEPTV